uniref:BEN domain-containing protein n=1 Tax=Anopheles stephensi TaxID=30069 RepID=A0A182YCI5_ANOST
MEQSKSISTCSGVAAHPDTGSFVESVDSCGTTVTSSCVPVENRLPTTYHLNSQGHVTANVLYKSAETFKRPEAGADVSQCWALIEWETSDEEPNSYTVIDSSQIIEVARENNQPDEESKSRTRDSGLYTGKLIHVLRGRYVMPATIVIISEDRKFLETELQELRIMAANNLISKSAVSAQTYRRQTLPTHAQDEGVAGNPFHTDSTYHTTVVPPARTIAARFPRNDHVPVHAPPMTFDQQTQTTGTSADVGTSQDANLGRIMSYLESIMAEQKGYRMESEYNRKMLLELQEKILDQHEMLRNVQSQLAKLEPVGSPVRVYSQSKENSPASVGITQVEQRYSSDPDVGLGPNGMIIDSYDTTTTITNNNHIVLESRTEHQQDGNSNQSWTSSKMDVLDTRKSTTPSTMDDASKIISESSIFIEELETTHHESAQSTSNCATEVHDLIENDWNDSMPENEGSEQPKRNGTTASNTAMVAIGSNNTMVSKSVLDNIKWVSYKFATRKLLLAVFPREVLATHSLSGRPCPTMINSTGKPVKQALDPNIVADVVELITKKFPVDESNVRAVITNKCADENKMLQKRNVTAAPANGGKRIAHRTKKSCNKENLS